MKLISATTINGIIASSVLFSSLLYVSPYKTVSAADQFYFSSTCLSDITTSDACNISFHRRSLSARFLDGRNVNIPYDSVQTWNYTDSTRKRIDYELARKIGIIGLLFQRAVHRHVFSLSYIDGFGDKHSLVINFSDTQYVLPVKSILSEYLGSKEV
jgi:hypothetical protein